MPLARGTPSLPKTVPHLDLQPPPSSRASLAVARPVVHPTPQAAHALAGAGTRPCGPRARLPSGTPASSSARCRSRSTAATAGPPPSCRIGRGTCAGTARQSFTHCRRSVSVGEDWCLALSRHGARVPRTPWTSSPWAAARAPAGAGLPGWPLTGPPPRCPAPPPPQTARLRP